MDIGLQTISVPKQEFSFEQYTLGHMVTSDTAFLVEKITSLYSAHKEQSLDLLDIGSGIGIISLMLAAEFPQWNICGIEIQEIYHHLAINNKENLTAFCVTDNLHFINEDVRKAELPAYDIIVSNPPYYKLGEGIQSPVLEKAICRHEISLNMPDLLNVLSSHLKHEAKAFVLYPERRRLELIDLASQYQLIVNNSYQVPNVKENKKITLFEVIHARD